MIDRMTWQRGYTYTDKALQLADTDIFQIANGMRLNVPKVSRLSWSLFFFTNSLIIHEEKNKGNYRREGNVEIW